ncbi:MAG: VCBS repeat-containing protein [Verrucomicrobia bacterium]|nr:VCBS repeat-containing protein [Verrucomicrobiota bacterium]
MNVPSKLRRVGLAFIGVLLGELLGFFAHGNGLEWESSNGFRSAPLVVPAAGKTGFTLLSASATGINFTNLLSVERSLTNQILLNGSGVAAGDVDGDGWCDLYFCGLDGPNKLFRNLGNWKFEDITAVAGVACPDLDATGAAFADIDGDGDLDLIVNSVAGGTHIFLNDGRGHFTKSAVLNLNKGGMSLALADIDGDGDLDLYVANYRTVTVRDQPSARIKGTYIDGKPVVATFNDRPATDPDLVGRFTMQENGKIIENGEVDVLFRNDGKGHFTPLSFTDGTFLDEEGKPLTGPPYDWGLSVMMRDLNGDGAPDIYVCNDFRSPDRIWLNDGKGKFRALPRLALRTTSMFSMGVDVADLNRDGFDDIFVADMLSRDHRRRQIQVGDLVPSFLKIGQIDDRPPYSRNTLLLNRSDGTYAEIAQFSGLHASEWTWTPAFLDVDLDGYEDLLLTSGHERDAMNADVSARAEAMKANKKMSGLELLTLNKMFARLDTGKIAFRNRGDLTFEEVSAAWGFDTPGVSHGMALVDLDNDGDLDVVVNNLNGAAGIYRNETVAPRVSVRLRGRSPNTHGIGAKIKVLGGPVPQSQEMICGGRYLSSDEAMRTFASGSLTNQLRIEVTWRDGKKSVAADAKPNRAYEIDEATATLVKEPEAKQPMPLFADVSDLIKHTHHEEAFDDFARQSLLPKRLSQLGPGVAWYDVDDDGWDDLIITSGLGGQLAVFRNDGHGGFSPMTEAPFNRPVSRDQTTVLGFGSTLLVGAANYEDGSTNGGWIRIHDLKRKVAGDSILGPTASCGPLAAADVDGDGDLDLFIGGRVIAGRYPEPAMSLLMKNEGGRLVPAQRFEKLGLVSGAVFSDLDGDGFPELILACEWGPVRVFRNQNGQFAEATDELGLGKFRGWWNGVTTGDLDGDGRPDIIASNWGLNQRYQTQGASNVRLFYGDFAGNGGVEMIESYFESAMNKVVLFRSLKEVEKNLPWVRERTPTFAAYAEASVAEFLGDRMSAAKELRVDTFASMVFLNRGDHFEARPLPFDAQLAPAFGISVGDADGDGNEDVFLSQNFFDAQAEMPRCDAGRGLWLRGDGKGGLQAMNGPESGVLVYGEQRGCALSDYDGDGRVDLVVTQNGAATKLFHNVGAKPGLRVRLQGPAGNTYAVGASLRLIFGDRSGPVREIHAGSGYWSQDSGVQVLGTPEPPTGILVRWPGGKSTTSPILGGAKEIVVSPDGAVKVKR